MNHIMSTIPMNRAGEPQDMVGACIFLASDESSFMTGTHIIIDGGVVGLR
jgi:NAD(P)-dependent dehydrogenase (short-subunit alcohol dehydrogenase family)